MATDGAVDPIRANNALWDDWTAVHERSAFYDLEGFKAGGIRLAAHEIAEVGDVAGLDLLHLQCHFGIDTLSWARLGARVTGADFSAAAIDLARRVATEIGYPDARFVRSELYDLPQVLDAEFDVVYTSNGVLGWLPDIRRWAAVVAHFVRPGGRFYIYEVHPVVMAFADEDVVPGELRLAYPYWEHRDPIAVPVRGSYADREADVAAPTEYGWDHGLGEIVTALVDAGLAVRSLREYPFLPWKVDFLVETPDGTWRLPAGTSGELPLSFSILATKPA